LSLRLPICRVNDFLSKISHDGWRAREDARGPPTNLFCLRDRGQHPAFAQYKRKPKRKGKKKNAQLVVLGAAGLA
jgi:hypothetical protein